MRNLSRMCILSRNASRAAPRCARDRPRGDTRGTALRDRVQRPSGPPPPDDPTSPEVRAPCARAPPRDVTFVHVMATNRGSAETTPASRVNAARKGSRQGRRSTARRSVDISCGRTFKSWLLRLCLGAPPQSGAPRRVHQWGAEKSTEVTTCSQPGVVTLVRPRCGDRRLTASDSLPPEALTQRPAGETPTSRCTSRDPGCGQGLPACSPATTWAGPSGRSFRLVASTMQASSTLVGSLKPHAAQRATRVPWNVA